MCGPRHSPFLPHSFSPRASSLSPFPCLHRRSAEASRTASPYPSSHEAPAEEDARPPGPPRRRSSRRPPGGARASHLIHPIPGAAAGGAEPWRARSSSPAKGPAHGWSKALRVLLAGPLLSGGES
ncbi:unnamed protein product [Urochloa humidicola]